MMPATDSQRMIGLLVNFKTDLFIILTSFVYMHDSENNLN